MTELAVITGAGSGIGEVIARHAVRAGYAVAAWDIANDAVRRVAADIGATATTVDVSSEDSILAAVSALPSAPSLLVNCAGMVKFGPLLDVSLDDWNLALGVNLTGTFLVSRTIAPRMATHGGGAVVNLASINGIAAAPNAGSYTASKSGIVGLTEQMAMEWAPLGVRANVIAPGFIDAGMSDAVYADPEVRRSREQSVPLGRLGTAADVADAALFLGSDRASYITAQTLTVDGGVTKSALAKLARPKEVDSAGVGVGAG